MFRLPESKQKESVALPSRRELGKDFNEASFIMCKKTKPAEEVNLIREIQYMHEKTLQFIKCLLFCTILASYFAQYVGANALDALTS